MFNTVENAIKFTDRGAVCISVSFVKYNGIYFVTIEVEDTGRGMKGSELSRLFLSISLSNQGTGLPFSRDLIESMGGSISVITKEGQGSIVCLHIPLKEYSTQMKPFEGKKALLVEDNVLNLETGSHLLKLFGFDVDTARDGMEGLNKAQSFDYDVILIHAYLPKISGIEVTKSLRFNATKPCSVIIALTAMPESLEIECSKYNLTVNQLFDAFIAKPFSPETFLGVLKQCFHLQ